MCVHCVLSGLFPGLWTCIETQRGLATATSHCQCDRKEPHCRRIRVEMRGISLPGQATKPNCSWSTGAIQVPVGYIHLAWLSISLFPVENCSQPNMFVRAGVETKVKSQHVCKLSWPEWNLWKTFCVCKSSLISDMMKIYLLKKNIFSSKQLNLSPHVCTWSAIWSLVFCCRTPRPSLFHPPACDPEINLIAPYWRMSGFINALRGARREEAC